MRNTIGVRSEKQEIRSMTVQDYLKAEEMDETGNRRSTDVDQISEDAVDELATLQCLTPRQIVTRWVKKLRSRKKMPEADRNCFIEEKTLTSLTHQESDVSVGQREQMTSFKVGAGIGLAMVVAASKNELDKMMELRKQMEMIVQNAKEELRCKSNAPCENPSYSTTNIEESINSNERQSCIGSRSSPSVGIQGKESPYIELDDKDWCGRECSEERCFAHGMAQLESELEAELQLLELQLDSSDISRENQDVVHESSESGCETLGCDEEVTYAYEPIDNFTEAHSGNIHPQELERRLHELLEAQQLERIKELEAALERTKQKLRKKEVEACWWKDTAHLISQHVSKNVHHNIQPLEDQPCEKLR